MICHSLHPDVCIAEYLPSTKAGNVACTCRDLTVLHLEHFPFATCSQNMLTVCIPLIYSEVTITVYAMMARREHPTVYLSLLGESLSHHIASYAMPSLLHVSGFSRRHLCLLQIPDLDKVYQRRLQARDAVNAQLSAKALQQAMQRCLPYPCHQHYTAVAMLPQPTLVNRVLASLGTIAPNNRKQAYWVLATAIGTAGALVAAKLWRRNK